MPLEQFRPAAVKVDFLARALVNDFEAMARQGRDQQDLLELAAVFLADHVAGHGVGQHVRDRVGVRIVERVHASLSLNGTDLSVGGVSPHFKGGDLPLAGQPGGSVDVHCWST